MLLPKGFRWSRYVLPGLLALAMLGLSEVSHGEEVDTAVLRLHLRSRVQPFKGNDRWQEVVFEEELSPSNVAIVICDMWDKHWCQNATARCDVLARKMAPLVEAAREAGVLIVHAPSDTMDFYKDDYERARIVDAPQIDPPAPGHQRPAFAD